MLFIIMGSHVFKDFLVHCVQQKIILLKMGMKMGMKMITLIYKEAVNIPHDIGLDDKNICT